MAQDEKDLKNKKQAVNSEKSVSNKSGDTNIDAANNAKNTKVVQGDEKSLYPESENIEKFSNKKSNINKELTSYEEQALQGATKSKGNKKLLIILLLLFGFLIIVGVAVALFFVLRPEEDAKAVVCKVEVLSYLIDRGTGEIEVVGSGDKFNFTKDTQETSSFTKDLDITINEMQDLSMTYLVNNVSENIYTYTLDFTSFEFKNCNVVVKVNNGETYTLSEVLKIVTVSHFGDVLLEIRISGINPPVYDQNDPEGSYNDMLDWAENTSCDGVINLTLELI